MYQKYFLNCTKWRPILLRYATTCLRKELRRYSRICQGIMSKNCRICLFFELTVQIVFIGSVDINIRKS